MKLTLTEQQVELVIYAITLLQEVEKCVTQ